MQFPYLAPIPAGGHPAGRGALGALLEAGSISVVGYLVGTITPMVATVGAAVPDYASACSNDGASSDGSGLSTGSVRIVPTRQSTPPTRPTKAPIAGVGANGPRA